MNGPARSREEFIPIAALFALAGHSTKNANPKIAAASAKESAEALADMLGLKSEADLEGEYKARRDADRGLPVSKVGDLVTTGGAPSPETPPFVGTVPELDPLEARDPVGAPVNAEDLEGRPATRADDPAVIALVDEAIAQAGGAEALASDEAVTRPRLPTPIPKRIHQIWIGPLPPPMDLIETWRKRNPTWEHWLWTSDKRREVTITDANGSHVQVLDAGRPWANQRSIDAMKEWNGKADLLRYEILEGWGGLHVDADAEAVEPLDDDLLEHEAWATFENEKVRPGVVTGAFMACVPGAPFMRDLIRCAPFRNMREIAWRSVGPSFVTEIAKLHPEVHVFPSAMFTPKHYTGELGAGDVPTYGRHLWGNTKGYGKLKVHPKVSAIVACKGSSAYLGECVEGLRAQTVPVDEIVIACGDRESAVVAQRLAIVHGGIVVLTKQTAGAGAARNAAIREAAHPWILTVDADDVAEPTMLEEKIELTRGDHFVITCAMQNFGDRNDVYIPPTPDQILTANPVGASALFTKKLWEVAGGYDETLGGYEDWEFYIRCATHRTLFGQVAKPLLRYRVHEGQAMAEVRRRGLDGTVRAAIRKRHPELYPDDLDDPPRSSRPAPSWLDSYMGPIVSMPVSASIPIAALVNSPHPEEAAIAWRPEILGWSTGILMFYRKIVRDLPVAAQCTLLGVYHGRDMLYLAELAYMHGKTDAVIVGVDPFEYYAGSFEATKRNARDVVTWRGGPIVMLERKTAIEAAKSVEDRTQDLVFVDSDHAKSSVLADVGTWLPKVKPGGIIAGHDYGHPDFGGVKAAVDELFGDRVHVEPDTVWMVRA